MTEARRAETVDRINRTRRKIESIVEHSTDDGQKMFGLVALNFTDLIGDMSEKLHDVAEIQGVQANILSAHVKDEDSMLSKLKGAVWAFTVVGGTLGALIVWVALGLVGDVSANGNDIKRLSSDVAVNSERLKVVEEQQRRARP